MVAIVAAAHESPTVTPAAALQAFQEAEAAYQRYRRLLPHTWIELSDTQRDMALPWLPAIEAHMQSSPGRWTAEIRQATSATRDAQLAARQRRRRWQNSNIGRLWQAIRAAAQL